MFHLVIGVFIPYFTDLKESEHLIKIDSSIKPLSFSRKKRFVALCVEKKAPANRGATGRSTLRRCRTVV
jgi:hypothetical protein